MRACSSTRWTATTWRVPSRLPPASRRRIPPRARRPPSTTSGVRRSGWRRFSGEPFEVVEPDLDQRADALLEPVLARHRQGLLVALPDLLCRNALFQAVVAGDEQVVNFLPGFRRVHIGLPYVYGD